MEINMKMLNRDYRIVAVEAELQGYTRDQAIEILKVYMLADIKSN